MTHFDCIAVPDGSSAVPAPAGRPSAAWLASSAPLPAAAADGAARRKSSAGWRPSAIGLDHSPQRGDGAARRPRREGLPTTSVLPDMAKAIRRRTKVGVGPCRPHNGNRVPACGHVQDLPTLVQDLQGTFDFCRTVSP